MLALPVHCGWSNDQLVAVPRQDRNLGILLSSWLPISLASSRVSGPAPEPTVDGQCGGRDVPNSRRGAFYRVNQAMRDFFGYDAETLMSKTWIGWPPITGKSTDLDKVADMVAGRIESYRMTKRFIPPTATRSGATSPWAAYAAPTAMSI